MAEDYTIGDCEGPTNETVLAAVATLMQAVAPGGMVNKFVLVVETIDNDDRWMFAFCAPGQKKWDTLGLLAYITALESNVSMTVPPSPFPPPDPD